MIHPSLIVATRSKPQSAGRSNAEGGSDASDGRRSVVSMRGNTVPRWATPGWSCQGQRRRAALRRLPALEST